MRSGFDSFLPVSSPESLRLWLCLRRWLHRRPGIHGGVPPQEWPSEALEAGDRRPQRGALRLLLRSPPPAFDSDPLEVNVGHRAPRDLAPSSRLGFPSQQHLPGRFLGAGADRTGRVESVRFRRHLVQTLCVEDVPADQNGDHREPTVADHLLAAPGRSLFHWLGTDSAALWLWGMRRRRSRRLADGPANVAIIGMGALWVKRPPFSLWWGDEVWEQTRWPGVGGPDMSVAGGKVGEEKWRASSGWLILVPGSAYCEMTVRDLSWEAVVARGLPWLPGEGSFSWEWGATRGGRLSCEVWWGWGGCKRWIFQISLTFGRWWFHGGLSLCKFSGKRRITRRRFAWPGREMEFKEKKNLLHQGPATGSELTSDHELPPAGRSIAGRRRLEAARVNINRPSIKHGLCYENSL